MSEAAVSETKCEVAALRPNPSEYERYIEAP